MPARRSSPLTPTPADALPADDGGKAAGFGRLALQAPDLPGPVRDMLERHARSLDLREALTDERSHRRLLARVRRELSELLATEGYFSPKFELSGEPPAIHVQAGVRAPDRCGRHRVRR